MPFNPNPVVNRLRRFPVALRAAVACITPDEARWKPAPQHWSVLEIVCHLADEEREDFAPRLRATLGSTPWAPLDFDDIANRRGYSTRALETELQDFETSRAANVTWLDSLAAESPSVDWTTAHRHPKIGPITAADLLCSWPAHDALHLRQIAKRLHNLAARDAEAEGHNVRYAGEWSP